MTKTESKSQKKAAKVKAPKTNPNKQKVGAITLAQETNAKPKPPRATGMASEPDDVDEYEVMRQAAVKPFRRSGSMPKPGAAGRLFDDEGELEDYDPLFDDVGEEEDE
ncbi:MAG: hypothetical protein R3E76_14035 [Planctomycetota bacterium]